MPTGHPIPATMGLDALAAMVRRYHAEAERKLTGWTEILGYLHDTWGLRRLSGKPLTITQVCRWKRDQGFPIIPGGVILATRKGFRRQLPLTSTVYVGAWILSQDPSRRLFAWSYSQRKAVPTSEDSTRSAAPRVAHEAPADVHVAYAAACTDRD